MVVGGEWSVTNGNALYCSCCLVTAHLKQFVLHYEIDVKMHVSVAESCFLGSWGDYGPCQNGVMIKHRPVIAGGVQCERKAVKTKPCS